MPFLLMPQLPTSSTSFLFAGYAAEPGLTPVLLPDGMSPVVIVVAGDPGSEEEEVGDEEDLVVAQPLADEDSAFDDFDDEFDDDFEEEENDPDWDHPDDGDSELPPGKGGGKKK